jgi:hypothetical protein
MEASLDLKLKKNKKSLIIKSVSSAIFLFTLFVTILSYVLVEFFDTTFRDALLNAIPFGIISSAVAIPAAQNFSTEKKEFIIYESSISDIIGIIVFDFVIYHQGTFGEGFGNMILTGIMTIIIAVITTAGLAVLLHKITYHINYIIIMTSVVMVYVLAKQIHLPALLLVLTFGMTLSNNGMTKNTFIKKYVDFDKFENDIDSFRKIVRELTFLVRSFFFVLFGYYTTITGLFDINNIVTSLAIVSILYALRWLFFALVLKMSNPLLILFAPRGLITILLFLSIPVVSQIQLITNAVTTLVILMTLILMMFGSLFVTKQKVSNQKIMISPD